MIMRGAPRARTLAVVMARACAITADLGGTNNDRRSENAGLGRDVLVPRQGHAPTVDRIRLGSRRRTRRDHAGAGALAGPLRSGQAIQDRDPAAPLRRWRPPPPDRAGPRGAGG